MSKKPTERTGDPETDAILDEMEQEGEALPEFTDAPDDADDDSGDQDGDDAGDDDEEDDAEGADDDESDEDEESEDADGSDDSDADDDEEGEDEEKDENDDDDSESDEDDDAAANEPLWKRNKRLKKELKEARASIEELTSKSTEADVDAQIDAFSKKHKVSKEAAKEMIHIAASIAAKSAGIDPELKKTLERVVKQDQQHQFWTEQDKAYTKDFTSNVAPLASRDGKNLKKVQTRLQELAFKPENVKKSLVELYIETYSKGTVKKPAARITSEGNRTHGRVQGSKAPSDLQPEDVESMSDEEFDEMSESLGKSSKSRIVRH